ncbi:MAG: lysophospholipid acyltransferase family protein [bacterium]
MIDKNKVEYFFFISFAKFFNLFGFQRAWIFAKIFGLAMYYIVPIRKTVVLKNLRLAFPEYSEGKIKNIARSNYYIFCKSLIELMCFTGTKKEKILSLVECDKIELIKNRMKENKGLILLTAHFSNFELIELYTPHILNTKINPLVKTQRNPYVSNWLNSSRKSLGSNVITTGISVRNLFKVLLDKGVIIIAGDQRGPADGVRAKIFNVDTALYTGAAVLALKTKAPVVMVLFVDKGHGKYKMEVEELNTEDITGNKDEQILTFTQRYMTMLEKYIRLHPDHWLWMHNIWKY